MFKRILIASAVLFSSTLSAATPVADALEKLVESNLKYSQQEDIDKVMATMHSQSPSYLPTKNAMASIFPNYEISYELLSFRFIAYDGDLAYARIKQRTRKISGPAFNDNEIDMVQAYRKEAGEWKIWSQMNIDIKYID